jgi:hypothetical protein
MLVPVAGGRVWQDRFSGGGKLVGLVAGAVLLSFDFITTYDRILIFLNNSVDNGGNFVILLSSREVVVLRDASALSLPHLM